MGRHEQRPTIRILVLGAAGVGKNCLESRFTTMAYPPLYDPSLTINSRRFFTLSPHQPVDPDPVTRPLDTSDGQLASSSEPRRPRSASTTFSNPGSQAPTTTNNNSPQPPTTPPSPNDPALPPPVCAACHREATYMVEVTNYPSLHHPKVRSHVLAKGEYDAVLLVYDITNRASFASIPSLHAEIPLTARSKRRKASSSSHHHTSSNGHGHVADEGRGETVVALIGNKSDVDHIALFEKEAGMQEAEVEQRGLVHPLYRESWFHTVYDDEERDMPGSPRSVKSLPVARRGEERGEEDVRRSVVSNGGGPRTAARREQLGFVPEEERATSSTNHHNVNNNNPPPTPPEPSNEAIIEKWIAFSDPDGPDDAVASTATEDFTRVDSRATGTTTTAFAPVSSVAKREVWRVEGEMLARTLLLNLPFYETSAKTGDNVEEVFGAIVREVLRGMGREVEQGAAHAPGEHGKGKVPVSRRERRREEKKEREGAVVVSAAAVVAREDQGMSTGHDGERSREGAEAVVLEDITAVLSPTAAPASGSHKRRRESVLGRFMKVFTKRSAVMVSDIAA
ncbi:hypothetical protein B0T19DRAFT_402324 [Cercophora scortea]|uniref:small monomeric GTPase n=1 Tax=Cercophora scortea TaxID=314031 RepID=A0AAE0IGV7_9PEZI|nr:hypothetical protein B0T19DRAFT_402324 [Cercophora scortea]